MVGRNRNTIMPYTSLKILATISRTNSVSSFNSVHLTFLSVHSTLIQGIYFITFISFWFNFITNSYIFQQTQLRLTHAFIYLFLHSLGYFWNNWVSDFKNYLLTRSLHMLSIHDLYWKDSYTLTQKREKPNKYISFHYRSWIGTPI